MELNGKRILLVGFAREGQATLRFLQRVAPLAQLSIADSNLAASPASGVSMFLGAEYLIRASQQTYDLIIRSPGVPRFQIAELFPHVTVLTAASLFLRFAPGVVLGVTGTKGKSTTSSMIAAILSERYKDVRLVGNIGKPALDYLIDADAETRFVCELSSFQLEDAEFSPSIAVLLPLVPEHLDRHGSFLEYARCKYNIFQHQDRGQFLITSRDTFASISPEAKTDILADVALLESRVGWKEKYLVVDGVDTEVNAADFRVQGKGALQNVLYAVLAGLISGVPLEKILAAIKTFEPLPHRLQQVDEVDGVTYVNDSLCTVPEALINALESFDGRVDVLIAGGHDRGISYEILAQAFKNSPRKRLLLFRGTGEKIEQAFKQSGNLAEVLFVNSMKEAVLLAAESAGRGGVVLMSPASSSFGMFKDYADRGEQFIKAVDSLKQPKAF